VLDGSDGVLSLRLDRTIDINKIQYIALLKIDVEGFEHGVLQSAEALFQHQKVRNVIFEFTPWWNGPGQGNWLEALRLVGSFSGTDGRPPRFFALHRQQAACLSFQPSQFEEFHSSHLQQHLQTDVFVTYDSDLDPGCHGVWTPGADIK
jgi:hypothetical protein